MRYSTELKFRKYVKGYGFLSFNIKFRDKYGKKLIDSAKKQQEMQQKLLLKESYKNCRGYRRFNW